MQLRNQYQPPQIASRMVVHYAELWLHAPPVECTCGCTASNGEKAHGSKRGCILGIPAKLKSAPPSEMLDVSNAEVVERAEGIEGKRLRRFALQEQARKLLPGSRTAHCLRTPHKIAAKIGVHQSIAFGTTHYSGLQTCSSVWACPVCAEKIAARRQIEVDLAIERHKATGGRAWLVTLTAPHEMTDNLKALLEGHKRARANMTLGSRPGRRLKKLFGIVGDIAVLETTHGSNGWHVHHHILVFTQDNIDLEAFRRELFAVWAAGCRLGNLPIPSEKNGVDVQDGSNAGKYICKWGTACEVTGGHKKRGRRGRRTPWQLLADAKAGSVEAGQFFQEYAKAFKGKQQLRWSDGLKAHFGIGEKKDEEIAAEQDDSALLVGEIERPDWKLVCRARVRGEVLELARSGWDGVEQLLSDLRRTDIQRMRRSEPTENG